MPTGTRYQPGRGAGGSTRYMNNVRIIGVGARGRKGPGAGGGRSDK